MIAFLWALLVLITLGFTAPFLFVFAGRRAHKPQWLVAAGVYAVLAWGGLVLAGIADEDSSSSTIAGLMLLAAAVGGSVHIFITRRELERVVARPGRQALEQARTAVEERGEAQRLAREEPQVALQMGVGRPDVQGAHHMGVVDVNRAGAGALARLPGVDDALAQEIVRAREAVDGFGSLEDLGMTLGADGDLVEDLRPYVVFLPR